VLLRRYTVAPLLDEIFRKDLPMIRNIICATATLGALALAAPAANAGTLKVGMLDCWIDGGSAYVIGSDKRVTCRFQPTHSGPTEHYTGMISKLGIDLGQTAHGELVWAVLAAGSDYEAGNLAGKYYGVNAEASVGYGGGANVLLGGFDRSYSLQPVSIQGQAGLNVAVAVTSLELTHALK
jgi:hypothetical protein